MRVVLQRVKHASVMVDKKIMGQIEEGFLALVGLTHSDDKSIVEKVVKKVIGLRVFSDQEDKMNLGLEDIHGSVLSISQFTLYADCKKGRRPSFIDAAKPENAIELYDYFNELIRKSNICVETGVFGADMKVDLLNDGPVTIILDSDEL